MARRHLAYPLRLSILSRNPGAPARSLCASSSTHEVPVPAVEAQAEAEAAAKAAASPSPSAPANPPRREEPLHETVLHMIRRRPWTTRLENSIRLLSPTLDAPLVHGVISGAASAGRADLALQFFRFAYRRGGFSPEGATFALLVPALASRRMLNHARCLVLDTMPSFSVAPDEPTLAALISAYGRAAIPQEAVKLFRMMPNIGVPRTALSYNAVLKAILCRGREAMARRIYNAMIADGVAPDVSTYNTLIWGFGLCKKMETAVRVFGDMKGHGVTPDVTTYNTLLNAWVRAGDLESARKVFDEMAGEGTERNSVSYNVMIKGYVEGNRVEEAVALFAEMAEKGLRLSEKTFAALMPGLCDDQGRVAEARKAVDDMAERRLTPKDKSVFLRLVTTLCKAGDLDGALEVHWKSGQFKHVLVDPRQYGVLMEGLCAGGKCETAIEVLDELMEKGTLLSPKSPVLEASAYNPVIEFLCSNVTENMDVAHKILEALFTRGHVEEAIGRVNLMVENGCMPDLDKLLVGLCDNGRVMEAQKLADFALDRDFDVSFSTYDRVLEALYAEEKTLPAYSMLCKIKNKGGVVSQKGCDDLMESLKSEGYSKQADILSRILAENAQSTPKRGRRVAMGA
ncbi:Pentatricopeptide repeat-containing protein [Zea mays]|uniref:Pentatricopeptide repeat-containing protein n=1 Tax=Zea mays TaxID=4577 RepID=A0A1D6GY72_MAIZE|nr:Pentatricopeptide repeat-containing protein [Zea mays]